MDEDGPKAAQHLLTEYLNLKKAPGIVIIVGRSFVFREAFQRHFKHMSFGWNRPPGKSGGDP
ncbi:hypothetical protein [Lacicoccus alkaliphilus]